MMTQPPGLTGVNGVKERVRGSPRGETPAKVTHIERHPSPKVSSNTDSRLLLGPGLPKKRPQTRCLFPGGRNWPPLGLVTRGIPVKLLGQASATDAGASARFHSCATHRLIGPLFSTMKSPFPLSFALLTATVLTGLAGPMASAAVAPTSLAPASRPVAIFTTVGTTTTVGGKLPAFQNAFATRILGNGFTVIDPKTVTNAVSSLNAGSPANPVDAAFADQTSALRLAQNLGAQYLILLSFDSYGIDSRAFTGYGVNVLAKMATLRASYRVCDATHGGAFFGDTATAQQTVPETANLTVINDDLLNSLVDDVGSQLAESFTRKANGQFLPAAAPEGMVDFSVTCTMADLVIPDILRAPDGQVVVGPLAYTVHPVDVTVALNGAVVGSAPGSFKGPAGLSKLRLTREGFKDWENIVSLSPGFKLSVAMQMSDAGMARWQQSVAFLQNLKSGTKLTDADVQKIQGIAEMFRQSGLRVDQRSDIKVNADEFPVIQQNYQSLFSTPPLIPGVVAPAPVKP